MISLDNLYLKLKCPVVNNNDDAWFWHKRIVHIPIDHLNISVKQHLIIGLPKMNIVKDKLCQVYQKGKQTKVSFKAMNIVAILMHR